MTATTAVAEEGEDEYMPSFGGGQGWIRGRG